MANNHSESYCFILEFSKDQQKWKRYEAKKPATHRGCQSMIDGPTSILGVLITLLYI